MNILKGFGIAILSFLLFLSLSVFGIAFLLKSTLLNPDFVAAQVAKMDVSALVGELTGEQIGGQLPEEALFVKEAIYDVVEEKEPWLKEQANTALYAGYDYFLGKSDSLKMAISLGVLKASLRDSLWQTFSDELSSDPSSLPEDIVKPFLDEHYQELIQQIPAEYLPPELTGLSEDQLKLYFDQHYQEFIAQIPQAYLTPEFVGQLKEQLEPYFDQYYQELAEQIPDDFTFDVSSLPPEAMEQIVLARQYIGYFQFGYYALIAFMVLLVAGIFLIERNVKGTTRTLGIDLLLFGALEFAAVYFARNYLPASLPLHDVPSLLRAWVVGVYGDMLAPLQMFSLGILIAGVILLVVSFVYKPRLAKA
jgi:hypothetical protein